MAKSDLPVSDKIVDEFNTELFIGRENEIQTIRDLLDKTIKGTIQGALYNITGVGGIGKTALLLFIRDLAQFRPKVIQSVRKPLYDPQDALVLTASVKLVNAPHHNHSHNNRPLDLHEICSISGSLLEPFKKSTVFRDYINETHPKGENTSEILTDLDSLLQRSEACLGKDRTDDRDLLSDVVQWISRVLKFRSAHSLNRTRRLYLLLLFDTADAYYEDILGAIETDILEPLLTTQNTVALIATRPRIVQWNKFEVRRRLARESEEGLEPFSLDETVRQLEKLSHAGNTIDKDQLHQLQFLAGGSPYLNQQFYLAVHQQLHRLYRIEGDRDKFIRVLEEYKRNRLFDRLNTDYVETEEEVANYEIYIHILPPRRLYRVMLMHDIFLQACEQDNNPHHKRWAERSAAAYDQTLRGVNRDTDLVRWEPTRRAFVLKRVVRSVLDGLSYLKQPETFRQKHKAAIATYEKYLERSFVDFWIEILFHYSSLYILEGYIGRNTKHKKPDKWYAKLLDHIVLLESQPTDNLNIIENLLKTDAEIRDLLPAEIDISVTIRNILNQRLQMSSDSQNPDGVDIINKALGREATHKEYVALHEVYLNLKGKGFSEGEIIVVLQSFIPLLSKSMPL